MICSLASSSFSSTCYTAQKRGMTMRKLRPLTQIKGFNRRHAESENLAYHIPENGSIKICASLPRILGKLEEPIHSNKDTVTSVKGDALVQGDELSIPLWTTIVKKLDALYRFTRPYTLYGTIIGIISISLLPVQSMSELSPMFFSGLLKAIVPTLLINIYMCAINQLTDIEIDKINKPTLPLASGEFSIAEGTAITVLSALSSLLMGALFNSPPLSLGIISIFFIGTAYSVDLPLLRWKEKPILTATSIIGIRALTIPLCIFAHMQKYVLGKPLLYTKPVFFTVAFMTIIATVISVIKDLPDMEGDEAFGLRSPCTTLGREKVFWSCVYALMATYGAAAVIGASSSLLPQKIITVLGHGILASILWFRANSVNLKEPSETLSFYLFVWKLLYAEYLLIPFIR